MWLWAAEAGKTDKAGRRARLEPRFPGRSTHRSPQVNELLSHLGHEGLLGHQGPVQALVELNQLAVHLRYLEHTSTTR